MAPRSEARFAAIAAGEKQYHGQPCSEGHTLRYVSNRTCVECDRLAQRLNGEWRNLYMEVWRAKHPAMSRAAYMRAYRAIPANKAKRAKFDAEKNAVAMNTIRELYYADA